MPGVLSGMKRIGPALAKIGTQRQAQSKAAIAGSKAAQAAPKPSAAPAGPKMPGIFQKMADFAKKKKTGGRQMRRPMSGGR